MSDARCRLCVWLVGLISIGLLVRCGKTVEASLPSIHIAFTSDVFPDVNENDAMAAVKVWGQMLVKERDVPAQPAPCIMHDPDAMLQSLQQERLDLVGVTLTEYHRLRRVLPFGRLLVNLNAGQLTERYVLLTHRESGVKTLADLGGCHLHLHTSPRTCLVSIWLDTLLVQQSYPTTSRFVGTISRHTKLSKVVLPVFFRQTDACVVTRRGFDTMSELNPQLARQLVVLAESPEVIPQVLAFRANYRPVFLEKVIAAIKDLGRTPAGRQLLTVFRTDGLAEVSASELTASLELIAARERLVRGDLSQ